MALTFDQIGVGRRRAALVCGIDDARLTNWMNGKYGMFRDEPQPRAFTYAECLSVRFVADALAFGLPLLSVIPAANQRSPWRALASGQREMRLVQGVSGALVDIGEAAGDPDLPVLHWPVRLLFVRTWDRFCAHACDQCRTPEDARHVSAVLADAGERLRQLVDDAT